MSKKESNPQPPGARPEPPPAPPGILTDNTEVIRTLEARIAELEAVAEAAEIDIRRKNGKGWMSAEEAGVWKALRAAGYLGGGE